MNTSSTDGGVFFGRKRICALLEKRFASFQKGYRQNIGIVGPPFIGKTFLVQTFLKPLMQTDIIPVPISCQEFDSFERFSQRWMSELLFSFYGAIGEPLPTNFQSLIRSLRGILPKTLQRMRLVKKLTFKHRYEQAYQELLHLSGILQQECGKKVLMILDEFHRLGELELDDPFGNLGNEIMIQKETMFLVTSSRPGYSATIFREKLSLLFGNFEVVELCPFDFKDADEFMKERFKNRTLDDGLKHFLIRMTDGHPYYLDLLAARLERCSVNFTGTNSDLLIEALTAELYERRGMLYQHFQSRLYQMAQSRPWPLFADVLLAIALGHKKFHQMIRFLQQKGNDVKKILERLVATEVVEKHGSLFQIPDPLFRFWLAKVYHRQRFLAERAPAAKVQNFREDVNQAIRASASEDKRELPKRIEGLFLKFRNDVVKLNKQKFKCPHFTEVLSRPNNGRIFPVFAKNGQTRWLCQVLSSPVTEENVSTFLEDLKRLRSPVHKKLIIGLKGIELNAKLLAQEAKIQYLDLRNLNFLLDLYDQPKLVI